jgi:hypothetical protein
LPYSSPHWAPVVACLFANVSFLRIAAAEIRPLTSLAQNHLPILPAKTRKIIRHYEMAAMKWLRDDLTRVQPRCTTKERANPVET